MSFHSESVFADIFLVFESPVWSSLLGPRVIDQDRLQKTEKNRSRPVKTGLGHNWSKSNLYGL